MVFTFLPPDTISKYFDFTDEEWVDAIEKSVPAKFLELNKKAYEIYSYEIDVMFEKIFKKHIKECYHPHHYNSMAEAE